jgi:hypothetical protein
MDSQFKRRGIAPARLDLAALGRRRALCGLCRPHGFGCRHRLGGRRFRPGFRLAAHRTIVNNLFQRTVQGHSHTCQARAPSATEKKMI